MRPPISHKHRHTKPATICQIRTLRRISESVKKKKPSGIGASRRKEKAGEAHFGILQNDRCINGTSPETHNAAPVEYPGWAALVYALDKKGVSPWGVS